MTLSYTGMISQFRAHDSYELQLHHRLQRQGIGHKFLRVLEEVGIKLAVSKVMLTVFTSNEPAFRFYTKFGSIRPKLSLTVGMLSTQARRNHETSVLAESSSLTI